VSLNDLIPQRPKPVAAPTVMRDERTGLQVEIVHCGACDTYYPISQPARLYIPGPRECCPVCADIQRRAQALLAARKEAIEGQVEQRLTATEQARQQRVDARLQAIVEAHRAAVESDERYRDSEAFRHEITAQVEAQIKAELRAEAGQ
jgi:hypothetical protein